MVSVEADEWFYIWKSTRQHEPNLVCLGIKHGTIHCQINTKWESRWNWCDVCPDPNLGPQTPLAWEAQVCAQQTINTPELWETNNSLRWTHGWLYLVMWEVTVLYRFVETNQCHPKVELEVQDIFLSESLDYLWVEGWKEAVTKMNRCEMCHLYNIAIRT